MRVALEWFIDRSDSLPRLNPEILVHPDAQGDSIVAAFGTYRPWSLHVAAGGDRSNYPEFSGRILDLKAGYPAAIPYFFERIHPEILGNVAVAVVPSHDPAKGRGGLHQLASQLAANGRIDASSCLRRAVKIDKLAHGGDRSLDVHLKSIAVDNADVIRGRNVLVLDDVMKTGNSLFASRKLLLDAGAKSVQCAAIGRVG